MGLVTEVQGDTTMAQVEMQCGPHRVVSLINREAVDDVGLRPGVLAVAVVSRPMSWSRHDLVVEVAVAPAHRLDDGDDGSSAD